MPASGNGAIIDSVDGSADGTPVNAPVYRADVGVARSRSCTCQSNGLSLQVNTSQSVRMSSPFIFHNRYGDATLEFLVKPHQQGHVSLFWTRADNSDLNRYNIAINSNGGFGFDYRGPSGLLHLTQAGVSLFHVPVDEWSHIAVVRDTRMSAPAHRYDFYLNGTLVTSQMDPNPDLPTSEVWQISGRGGFMYSGWIDEIRFSSRMLTPSEFLVTGPCCPVDFNQDGFVTSQDFFDFLAAFFGLLPSADFNGDGVNNSQDFFDFLGAFLAGC
jgi:hypothetical protein